MADTNVTQEDLELDEELTDGTTTETDNTDETPTEDNSTDDESQYETKTVKELIDYEFTSSEENEDELEALKKKIRPYSKNSEILETFQKMINIDGDYIRRYMVSYSNIAFQKNFYIDAKSRFLYKAAYNNDSHYYNFSDDKVLLIFDDFTLYSQNYEFYLDVFINGERLSSTKYTEVPSSAHYNFTTGKRRLFIDGDCVDTGDTISVVAKKYKKMKSYSQYFYISDSSKTQYSFKRSAIGEFNGLVENLMVFKKTASGSNYIMLDETAYCIVDDGDTMWLSIDEDVSVNSSYLIINKMHKFEETIYTPEEVDPTKTDLENDGKYTKNDYLKYFAKLRYSLLTNIEINKGDKNALPASERNREYLPLPVSCAEELEVYMNGYRLVPNVDYKLINDEDENGQQIEFSGILKQDTEVVIRNKNILSNKLYGFYSHTASITAEGFVPFNKYMIPISEQYLECYLGRRRLNTDERRIVCNTVLKIDSQHTFLNCECFMDIEFNPMLLQLLAYYNETKPTLTQISDVYRTELLSSWKTYNDLDLNDNTLDNDFYYNNIFLGKVNYIEVIANPTVTIEGKEPEFTVIGHYDSDNYGIDITDSCQLSMFNKFQLGVQTVTAYYTEGDETFTGSIDVEVIYKGLISISIITDTNLFILGDAIKDNVRVLAKFEDGSEKFVTENCTIEAPEYATEVGSEAIKVTLNYNNQTITDTKYVLVSDTSDRKITSVEAILDTYIKDDASNYSTIRIFATYNNNYVQQIGNNLMNVYIVRGDELELIEELDEVYLPLNEDVTLKVDVFTNTEKTSMIPYEDVSKSYITIRVLRNVIDIENRIVIFDNSILKISESYEIPSQYKYYRIKDADNGLYLSIGENEIGSEAICLGSIETDQLLIVEFLDDERYLMDQLLFKARSADYYKESINANMVGNIVNGYTVQINKIVLGKEIIDLDVDSICLKNEAGDTIITTFDLGKNDSLREANNIIYFNFFNFAVNNGSVKKIADYIYAHPSEENAILYILNCDKNIVVKLPQVDITRIDQKKMVFKYMSEDELDLVITPDLPLNNKTLTYAKSYEVRPELSTIVVNDDSSATILADTTYELLVPSTRYGLNRYISTYVDSEGNMYFYVMDVVIGRDEEERVRVLSINDVQIDSYTYFKLALTR